MVTSGVTSGVVDIEEDQDSIANDVSAVPTELFVPADVTWSAERLCVQDLAFGPTANRMVR